MSQMSQPYEIHVDHELTVNTHVDLTIYGKRCIKSDKTVVSH